MKRSSERLGVKIVGGLKEVCTPWSGVSLLVDLYREDRCGHSGCLAEQCDVLGQT